MAVIVWAPVARLAGVTQVATPETRLALAQPEMLVPPSLNATLPAPSVGLPDPGGSTVTVTVRVTGWP